MDIESIVEDCKNDDSDAFGVLYRTFSLPMLGVIGYYIHNQDVAKDILHDGFIVAYTSISSLKDGAKVESWLTTIMKNLSLQYLRKEADHISIPISDTVIPQEIVEQPEEIDLSWEDLQRIINRLPEGYNKVFRLNVLDGLSHKEIANILGISHLTSASQLHHAKVILRRMINKYRMGIGVFTIVMIISVCVYNLFHRIQRHNNTKLPFNDKTIVVGNNNPLNTELTKDKPNYTNNQTSKIITTKLHKRILEDEIEENDDTITEESQIIRNPQDSIIDSVKNTTSPVISEPLIANNDNNMTIHSNKQSEWSISLAYSGSMGVENTAHNIIPDISSGKPDGYTEETTNVRHYMPVTFGISFSKTITKRWNIESGLRYTYLRTDQTIESKFSFSESIQKVHYIGIPLKFNYTILNTRRFSLYGQGGAVLDIPFKSTLLKKENIKYDSTPVITKTHLNVPAQWSVEGGIGVQYQLTPSISIYAEPSFKYYFNTGGNINTIRQEKPLELTIPIGIKMTW